MMHGSTVTVVGEVVEEPRHVRLDSGIHVLTMRVAASGRANEGPDCDSASPYLTVTCWRAVADNVAISVTKGDPVVVSGRLRIRTFPGRDARRRISVEVEAATVGHDLSRGVARFHRRGEAPLDPDDLDARDATWRAVDHGDGEGAVPPCVAA